MMVHLSGRNRSKLFIFFRLIRWPNLLMMACSMYLMRHAIILPLLTNTGLHSSISELTFFLLTFALVCIATAGYILNDYLDTETDSINKPERTYIPQYFSKKQAIVMYQSLTLFGLAIALFYSNKNDNYFIAVLYVFSCILLYFYSYKLQRFLFVGNLTIALLTSFTILTPLIFENQAFSISAEHTAPTFTLIIFIISMYAFFAFFTTLIRELIKDAEDVEGDKKFGYKTVAVKYGYTVIKRLCFFISFVILIPTLIIAIRLLTWEQFIVFWCLTICIIIPLILVLIRISTAKTNADFSQISTWLKLIMISGIMSSLFFLTAL